MDHGAAEEEDEVVPGEAEEPAGEAEEEEGDNFLMSAFQQQILDS